MKIAIPVEKDTLSAQVSPSFGRAPYFLFYDTDTKNAEFMLNDAASSQGGAGIKAAQIIADNHVDTLLTPRCGKNAAEVLEGASITIYKTNNSLAQDNINAFLEGTLQVMKDFHEGLHGHHG